MKNTFNHFTRVSNSQMKNLYFSCSGVGSSGLTDTGWMLSGASVSVIVQVAILNLSDEQSKYGTKPENKSFVKNYYFSFGKSLESFGEYFGNSIIWNWNEEFHFQIIQSQYKRMLKMNEHLGTYISNKKIYQYILKRIS